jgi:hypothetical protein
LNILHAAKRIEKNMAKKSNKRILGMRQTEFLTLGILGGILLCILVIGGGYIIYSLNGSSSVAAVSPISAVPSITPEPAQSLPTPTTKPTQTATPRPLPTLTPFNTVIPTPALTTTMPDTPVDPEAKEHFYQGIEYIRQDNNDLAIQEFTRAIELDPDYYYAYYNRALVYCRDGELESCLADYDKAIELRPDNVYWTIERGFLHMELGDRKKAIIDLERAQELGVPYEYRQRVEEALAQLNPK